MALPMRPAIACVFSVAACTPAATPAGAAGPIEAVQGFSAAVQKGDAAAGWALLSSRTRAAANEQAAASRKGSGGAEPESGRQMLFGSALPRGNATGGEVKLLDERGDEAHVAVSGTPYRVVREGERWLVDLDLEARDAGTAR